MGSNVYGAMKYFILLLLFCSILEAQTFNKYVILDVSSTKNEAKKMFDDINTYIGTQEKLQAYLSKHKIGLTSRKVSPYVFYILGPLTNMRNQHELYYFLHKKFPNMFSVNNMVTYTTNMLVKKKSSVPIINVEKEKLPEKRSIANTHKTENTYIVFFSTLWKNLQSEWIGLLVLAFVGFMLILRSAKQISKIKHLQQEVEAYQQTMSTKVQSMGEMYE